MSNFNFGAGGGGAGAGGGGGGGGGGSFSFGTTATTCTPATQTGFTFGATAQGANALGQSAPGFNFGMGSFGSAAAPSAVPAGAVNNMGISAATTAAGFNFGGTQGAAATTKPAATVGFGGFKLNSNLAKPAAAATAATGSSGGLNLTTKATPTLCGLLGAGPTSGAGAGAAPATGAVPTLTLGAGGGAQTGFNFGGIAKTTAAAVPATATSAATAIATRCGGLVTTASPSMLTGIGSGLNAPLGSSITGGLKLGAPAAATTPAAAAAVPAAAAAPTATAGFSLGGLTAGPAAVPGAAGSTLAGGTGFSLGGGGVGVGGGGGGGGAAASTQVSLSTATTTTSSGARAPTMTYHQLEEQINKWMLELDDQEKNFLQKATQVNAWDRLLIDNGEKITGLNTDVERMKIDQQRLDHELDFILAQQRELEEMLNPLEKSVEQLPPINYQQHADLEREHTYQLAENVDAQLKRMCQDLKEIIEHLNTNNSSTDNSDPIYQIGKILNVHIDSIQWIDQNTALLQRRVEDVSKQAELRRKEQERNFRLAYN